MYLNWMKNNELIIDCFCIIPLCFGLCFVCASWFTTSGAVSSEWSSKQEESAGAVRRCEKCEEELDVLLKDSRVCYDSIIRRLSQYDDSFFSCNNNEKKVLMTFVVS